VSKISRPIRTTTPSFEPVTLAQARVQVRIAAANTDHDSFLTRLIQEARELWEHDTQTVVATGTFTLSLDYFEGCSIELPLRPVTSITSVQYRDIAGTLTTFSSSKYSLSNSGAMPSIVLGYNEMWPDVRGHHDDVLITFVAGYAAIGDVPEVVKQAVLLEVKNQFESEETQKMTSNFGFDALAMRFARPTYP